MTTLIYESGTCTSCAAGDYDSDSVCDDLDRCPGTPTCATVDANGCPYDSDGDGALDGCDQCPQDPNKTEPGLCGCGVTEIDSDGDGAPDCIDTCPNDPDNDADQDGMCGDVDPCPNDAENDADADGICGDVDQCPGTPSCATVNDMGCPSDSDGDGVFDGCDACGNTISGSPVYSSGCPPVIPGDLNRDGDVDLADIDQFHVCSAGPAVPYDAVCLQSLPADVVGPDFDNDADIDSNDFVKVQLCFSGTDVQGDPNCLKSDVPEGMVLIPAGEFMMGDAFNDGSSDGRELPLHAIYVSAFYIERTEVTNQQYANALNWAKSQGSLIAVADGVVYKAGSGTSFPYCDTTTSSSRSRILFDGSSFGVVSGRENHPMARVSWYGAVAYCNWRSGMQARPFSYDLSNWECSLNGGYRLPTEAEWEKAARGGAAGRRFPWSDSDYIQHARANYYSSDSYSYDNSPTRGFHSFVVGGMPYNSPVGYFAPNGYGLYDMAGNVFEWCNDWFSGTYYNSSPYNNPPGPISGTGRVIRGGGWDCIASVCRVAYRGGYYPGSRDLDAGFRLALGSP